MVLIVLQPPRNLNYPRYEGCIELNSLNERIISLYNFKRTFNLNTTDVQPCRRYDMNIEVFHSSVILSLWILVFSHPGE